MVRDLEAAGRLSAEEEDVMLASNNVDLEKILNNCFPSPLRHIDRYADTFGRDSCRVYDPNNKRVDKKISKGESIDLISFLSRMPGGRSSRRFLYKRDGTTVDINALKGKYVVVCCVFLPLHYRLLLSEAMILRGIIYAASIGNCPFQLVIVPKLLPRFEAFRVVQHFFSALPSNCLTIDYRDSLSCDHICNSLGLSGGSSSLSCLIVDPAGTVLQTDCKFFRDYGIDAFPFTDGQFDFLSCHYSILRDRVDSFHLGNFDSLVTSPNAGALHATLDELLICHPSHRLPLAIATKGDVSTSVSDLNAGYLGLYLCNDGSMIPSLAQLHQQCTKNGHQFPILIIPLAFLDPPSSFLASIRRFLREYNISSWWLFPFNDRVCRRLWKLTDCSYSDELVILPPARSGLSGELNGRVVIIHFGFDVYPFTRASILKHNFERLRNLTLKHLFPKDCTSACGSDKCLLNVSRLQGKEVIIYLDPEHPSDPELLFCLSEIWHKHPDSALVYVPPKSGLDVIRDSPMPWLVSRSTVAEVISILFEKREQFYGGTIVAVGKNGVILSRHANLRHNENCGFLFADHLRRELVSDLAKLDDLYD